LHTPRRSTRRDSLLRRGRVRGVRVDGFRDDPRTRAHHAHIHSADCCDETSAFCEGNEPGRATQTNLPGLRRRRCSHTDHQPLTSKSFFNFTVPTGKQKMDRLAQCSNTETNYIYDLEGELKLYVLGTTNSRRRTTVSACAT